MKRDMDLVRAILLKIESSDSGYAPRDMSSEGFSEEQVGYHVFIMIEAGLIMGPDVTTRGSSSPQGMATRLTWQGHEFLDASRDPTRWEKAKGIAGRIGGATIHVLGQILTRVMMSQVDGIMS